LVIDFSKVDPRERPVLVLQNADDTDLQTLGYAMNVSVEPKYNEVSTLSFGLPAQVEGEPTPGYDLVVGERVVDVVDLGRFILSNPKITKSGPAEIKSCKAYSLEYELTRKKMSLEEGTYEFYNLMSPESTVLGIMMSYVPSWSIGSVDDDLIGKYRTFSSGNVNVYDFAKSTLQKTYGCIFEFDTYNRVVNVRSTTSKPTTQPVYLSTSNLIKEFEVEENTEDIVTVLSVAGADGLDIRMVNPLGTDKIYNLDYFMNESYFTKEMIDKWNAWKKKVNDNRKLFYDTSVSRTLKTSEIFTEQHALKKLEEELAVLENSKSTYVQYLASITSDHADYAEFNTKLSEVNAKISDKNAEITNQKALIKKIEDKKSSLTEELTAIINSVSIENNFTREEFLALDRYFIEDGIEEASFVVSPVESYSDAGIFSDLGSQSIAFSGCEVTKILRVGGSDTYSIKKGTVTFTEQAAVPSPIGSFSAKVISASLERNQSTNRFVLSCYIGDGEILGKAFKSGCITVTGTCESITDDTVVDGTIGVSYMVGTSVSLNFSSAKSYFTTNVTEYESHSVAWDLYDYGQECLDRLAYPSYNFSVTSADFLRLREFEAFKKALTLGDNIYIDAEDGDNVLTPIFTGAKIDFGEAGSLSLNFSNSYKSNDPSFELVDLLEQSVSMGRTVNTERYSYNSFIDSGASTNVKNFMTSALDVSKNNILSSSNIAVSWDSSGIHCRMSDGNGGYEPEQIAIINNSIVFTDDNWQTAKMAIGAFYDKNVKKFKSDGVTVAPSWGVVAPNIVGTMIAGKNLVIESEKQDGGVSVFKVDGNGAVLHNAKFDIVSNNRHIILDPTLGFGIGTYPVINTDGTAFNEANAKFWVDTDGNIHIKGKLEGCDGEFSGKITATDSEFSGSISSSTITGGTISGGTITGGSINIGDGKFVVDDKGNLTASSGSFSGDIVGANYYALDSNGNRINMMSGGKFVSDYLELNGLTIINKNTNTPSFVVSTNGEVTINGTITGAINMGAGSSISWDSIDETGSDSYALASEAKKDAAVAKEVADAAKEGLTYIDTQNIYSPNLYGDQISLLDKSGGKVGTISLKETDTYAFDIQSQYSVRVKANSGYNTYIANGPETAFVLCSSDGYTKIGGYFALTPGTGYGYDDPPDDAIEGQVYFKLS